MKMFIVEMQEMFRAIQLLVRWETNKRRAAHVNFCIYDGTHNTIHMLAFAIAQMHLL